MTDELPGSPGDWVTEHRYRAVLQVLECAPKAQVAREFGTSRQSVHSWVARYRVGGLAGLVDGSRRPHSSPNELAPGMVAMICELRRTYPRWGRNGSPMRSDSVTLSLHPRDQACIGFWYVTTSWPPSSRTTSASTGAGSAMPLW